MTGIAFGSEVMIGSAPPQCGIFLGKCMSRLIREPEQKTPAPDVVIDDAVVLKLLKVCQSMVVDQGRGAFLQYLAVLDEVLNRDIDMARSNQERAHLTQLQKQLRQKAGELERYYCGCLAENFVRFRKQQLNTVIAHDIGSTLGLELLDNEKLEESLALSRLSQRANVYYAESLWALNRRMSVLNRGEKVAEESNPVAPIQLGEALRRTLQLVQMGATDKARAYRVYDESAFNLAGVLIVRINEYLKAQGVLPHLHYSLPTGAMARSYLAERDAQPGEQAVSVSQGGPQGASADANLVEAIRDLQTLISSASVNVAGPGTAAPSSVGSAHSMAVSKVLAVLAHLPDKLKEEDDPSGQRTLAPADIQAVAEILAREATEGGAGALGGNAMQTIDLVGMLFEYMLSDENLPAAVKARLSYLHTPFLKLAFVDPGFFEQSQHPARLLLNNLAEAGARWVRDDGSSEFGIYEKIKEIVNRVLRDFDNDVRVIAELLFEFSSYTKDILRRQELMEKRAKEKAQGEEKLRSVKQRVNECVHDRIDGRELPSAILLLLLQPWSDYLSFILLRYGDDSDQWHDSLAVVDDILWCIEPKQSQQEQARQKELQGQVLQALASGFGTIGYDQSKADQLIESVDSLIVQVMQKKKVEPAPAPMRDELERLAAEKAGGASEREQLTPEEAKMVDNLKMVEFGTWLEFEGGQRLKVAWYNNRTSHYMLVDQMGKRAAMMSGVDMARSMIAGKARVISGSAKPFFDRALENIFQKLNAQAEALQSHDV
jgi:hypothetical protein